MHQVLDWLVKLPPGVLLGVVFLLPLLEASAFVGILVPGETAVLVAGVVASQGGLALWLVILVASAGAIIGDSVGYQVGKRYGRGLLNRLPTRLVKPQHIDSAGALLRRRGGWTVFVGRFTTALRVVVPGMAGISRMPYPTFLVSNALGGIAWAVVVACVGFIAGKSYHAAEQRVSITGLGLFAALIGLYLVAHLRHHPRAAALIDARLSTKRWTGRPLTLVIAAAGGSAWMFGGVAQDVVEHNGVARYDPRWHRFLIDHRPAAITDTARVLTYLGSNAVAYVVVAVAVVVAVWRGRSWSAIMAIPLLFVGQLLRFALAVLIHRPRPPRSDWLTSAQGYAFPSGHTATAVLAWGLAAALAWPWLRGRGRAAVAAVVAVIAVVVGATRAYLGVHWPSDVLGGWALGGLLLTLAVTGLSLLQLRSRQPHDDGDGVEADLAPGTASPRL